MEYFSETLDRSSGELVRQSIGEWSTITEYGKTNEKGPRQTRHILARLDVLQTEGTGKNHRYRLARWITDRGLGKRLRPSNSYPFDVLSPELQEWIDERWSDAVTELEETTSRSEVRTAKEALEWLQERRPDIAAEVRPQVYFLADHFPDLQQSDMADLLCVSPALVSRHLRQRREQRARASELKAADPDELMGTLKTFKFSSWPQEARV